MSGRLDALVKSVIFPRPKPASFDTTTHADNLYHIPCVDPRTRQERGRCTHGYLFSHPDATHLLIYAHPNAVDIGMMYGEMQHLSTHAAVHVLAVEYSGYGMTQQDITEASVNEDVLSAHVFAQRYLGVAASRIILCGRSIGAAPMARLAATLPASETPSLLILQCPFTALSECIQELSQNAVSIANFLGYNWFRTIDIIADVRCPVVLQHGTRDTTVPVAHTYQLRERRDSAARPCVTYVYQEDGKGHNNLSRTLLARIVREKVDADGTAPLLLTRPACLLAHPPLHPYLFPPQCRRDPLRLVFPQWRQTLNLRQFLRSRDSLYALLTASVTTFAMRVAYEWQLYCEVAKRNARNRSRATASGGRGGEEYRRCSKEDFVAWAEACGGGPLEVQVPVAGLSRNADALVFGSYVPPGKWSSFDVGWHFSTRRPGPMVTVARLRPTAELRRLVQSIISSAPDLFRRYQDGDSVRRRRQSSAGGVGSMNGSFNSSARETDEDRSSSSGGSAGSAHRGANAEEGEDDGDEDDDDAAPPRSPTFPAFIHAELVSAVQAECERIVGCMNAAEADQLEELLGSFEEGGVARLSAKTRAAAGHSFAEETFDELREWLQPYLAEPVALSDIAAEVPWDFYLLKARVLAARHRLALDMDWDEWLQVEAEIPTVLGIYRLFERHYLGQ